MVIAASGGLCADRQSTHAPTLMKRRAAAGDGSWRRPLTALQGVDGPGGRGVVEPGPRLLRVNGTRDGEPGRSPDRV